MKQSLVFGFLGVTILSILLFITPTHSNATLTTPECSYPCGTESSPTNVQAPVSLGVSKQLDADQYRFSVWTEAGGLVEASGDIKDNSYTTAKITARGVYKWVVVILDTDTSTEERGSWFFNVTKICPPGSVCIQNPLTTEKFTDVVDRILNILFFVALAVAPVMIIVAGFKFLTGGGDPKNITAARQMLIWTGVGFSIILLSKGIVLIVRGVIGF